MASPTVQSVGAVASVASGNLTLNYPTSPAIAADDILVACITLRDTVGCDTPSGWTLIRASLNGNTATSNGIASAQMFWKRHDGTGASVTFTRTGGNLGHGVIIALRGCLLSGDPVDNSTIINGSGAAGGLAPSNLTTSVADTLLVWQNSLADNGTVSGQTGTTPATWTERVDNGTNTGADGGINVNTAPLATATTTSGISATASIAGTHIVILSAFKSEPPSLTNDVLVRRGADSNIITTALTVTALAAQASMAFAAQVPSLTIDCTVTAPQVTFGLAVSAPASDTGTTVINDVVIRRGANTNVVSTFLAAGAAAPQVTFGFAINAPTATIAVQNITPPQISFALQITGSVQRADANMTPDPAVMGLSAQVPTTSGTGEIVQPAPQVSFGFAVNAPTTTVSASLTPPQVSFGFQIGPVTGGVGLSVTAPQVTFTTAVNAPTTAISVQNITAPQVAFGFQINAPVGDAGTGGPVGGGSTPGVETRTETQLEVWTNLQCAGGQRMAIGIPATSCIEQQELTDVMASSRLRLVVPDLWEPQEEMLSGRVIRISYPDNSFDEFRIDDVQRNDPPDTIEVVANGAIFDLAIANTLISETTGTITDFDVERTDTPAALMAYVLGFAPSWFTVGTVTPTGRVTVRFNWSSPLAGLQAIAAAVKAAEGIGYELSIRRNGTTGYFVDLTLLNSTAAVPQFRTGKNLQSLRKNSIGRDFGNRVYPQMPWTDQTGIGEHLFIVTAVSANQYIEIEDPAFRGINPIVEDDALNGKFWVPYNEGAGTSTARSITDSVRSTKRLHMASTSGIVVGDMGRIARTSSKEMLGYVERTSSQAGIGLRVIRLTVPEIAMDNMVANASLARWTAGAIDAWTSTGAGWPVQDTTHVFTGAYSARLQNQATSNFYEFGPRHFFWTQRANLKGKYRIWFKSLRNGDPQAASININVGDPALGDSSTTTIYALTNEVLDWTAVTSSEYTLATNTRQRAQVIFRNTGTASNPNARFYIGAVEFLVYESGASLPVGLVPGSNTTGAWLRGVSYLLNDPSTYDAGVTDLHRVDRTVWSYDELKLGGSIALLPDRLPAATLRMVGIEKDHLIPSNTRLTFTKLTERLSTFVAST